MQNFNESNPTHSDEMTREHFESIAEEIMLEESMEKYYEDKDDITKTKLTEYLVRKKRKEINGYNRITLCYFYTIKILKIDIFSFNFMNKVHEIHDMLLRPRTRFNIAEDLVDYYHVELLTKPKKELWRLLNL